MPSRKRSASNHYPILACPLPPCFPDVDVSVKVFELNFRTTTIESSVERLFNVYVILAALAAIVFLDLVWR